MASMFLSSTTDETEVATGVSKAEGLDCSDTVRVVLPSYGSERSPERHCGESRLKTDFVGSVTLFSCDVSSESEELITCRVPEAL